MKEENLQTGTGKQPDRRVRKTKTLLRHCLAELLREKKINEITVKELTELSDLNRGTFYLHYRDVFDLLEQTENELIAKFDETLRQFAPEKISEHSSTVLEEVFTLVQENRDIVGILIGDNGDLNFMMQLRAVVEKRCLSRIMDVYHAQNTEYFNVYSKFLLSGCIGIVQYWIATDCAESPKKLAMITERIITEGVGILDPA